MTTFINYQVGDWGLDMQNQWLAGWKKATGLCVNQNYAAPRVSSYDVMDVTIDRRFDLWGGSSTLYFIGPEYRQHPCAAVADQCVQPRPVLSVSDLAAGFLQRHGPLLHHRPEGQFLGLVFSRMSRNSNRRQAIARRTAGIAQAVSAAFFRAS